MIQKSAVKVRRLNAIAVILGTGLFPPVSVFGAEARYIAVPIYTGLAAGLGLNDNDSVIGEHLVIVDPNSGEQYLRAFVYTDGMGATELPWPDHSNLSAVGINNSGQIAVYGGTRPSAFQAYRYTPSLGYEPLRGFGGATEADAINNRGQVTGFSTGPDGITYAYRYTDGIGMENLGARFEFGRRGFAINEQGWVAGAGDGRAWLYRDDTGFTDLTAGIAYGINNRGDVVGEGWNPFGQSQAFVYVHEELRMVGGLGGDYAMLSDINDDRFAVGMAVRGDGTARAILWSEQEGLIDLNSLIPTNGDWNLETAAAINENGQITGQGHHNGQSSAYRLDPIHPRLHIELDGTNLVVSWAPRWPDYVLESTPTIPCSIWLPIPGGTSSPVTLPRTGPTCFFRLRR